MSTFRNCLFLSIDNILFFVCFYFHSDSTIFDKIPSKYQILHFQLPYKDKELNFHIIYYLSERKDNNRICPSILDREARQGRPLGSTLPQVIVNDPYRAVIPPLTQQEIRQTAQQILSANYNGRSYTDQTLRWFLSRDNRTEVESAKYLQTLDQYRDQQYVTEKLAPINNSQRTQSKESLHNRPPSMPPILHPPSLPQNYQTRSQSQPRPRLPQTPQQRSPFSFMQSPLSRHQSVHELHTTSSFPQPPSPSPSLHNLHHQQQQRLPVSFHNRASSQQRKQPVHPLLTEIIDSQTGQRILTTSQEQLPTEVLGLLNKYNLQQF